MTTDNVKCTNCDFDGLVPMGTEECPSCNMVGSLAWKDEEEQEVEVPGFANVVIDNAMTICSECHNEFDKGDKAFIDPHFDYVCKKCVSKTIKQTQEAN